MNGKQLKNSILQWAIQGKLVQQDPNDEPASVLLERIRAEKKRLIKEGKIKKDKNESIIFRGEDNSHYEKFLDGRVVCIDNEIPFEIPQRWEWTRLGDVFELRSGQDFPPEKYSSNPGGTLYLTGASNLDGEKILENRWTKTPSVIAPFGSLLLVCKGSGVGKMCMMNLPEAHIARQLQAIIPISQDIDIRIIQIALECRIQEITQKANGVIPGIAREAVLSFLLPIPPLNEQERILDKVLMLSPLIDRYREKQQTLDILNCDIRERLKKSILQETIQGKLVPQDPTDEPASILLERIRVDKQKLMKEGKLKKKDLVDSVIFRGEDNKYYEKVDGRSIEISEELPFDIPSSWAWCRLGFVIVLQSGQDLIPEKYFSLPKGIPYITGASNFSNSTVIVNRWTNSPTSISHKGDLLITCKGTVGTMAYNTIGDIHIARQIMSIHSDWILIDYIEKYLEFSIPTLEKSAHSIIPGISRETILNTLIPIPPLKEQRRIVDRIKEIY